jgi:type IV pilus assembly protein PilO
MARFQLGVNKLPWYGQVALFVAVSAGAAGGFYYLHAAPAQVEMDGRRQQLESLRADIRKAQGTARQLPEFQAQVKDLEGRLESLKAVLPEQKDVSDLLRRIQTVAAESNLRIKGFRPQPITTKQMHAEWPIVLEIDGTYHNLGFFFDRISKFSRIINISDLNIRAAEQSEGSSTITAQLMATTFVLLESPPAPTGTTGTAPAP